VDIIDSKGQMLPSKINQMKVSWMRLDGSNLPYMLLSDIDIV